MKPPKWSVRLLEWFCPDELLEGILGDLLEQYEADCERYGPSRSGRRFTWNVLRLFHPTILFRNSITLNVVNMGMLISHLRVAGRNMLKHRFFSFINLLGLSCTIAFVLLTFLFIRKERSFDQFHKHKDTIFRVYHDVVNSETGQSMAQSAVTAVPLARDLAAALPGIRHYSRYASSSATVRQETEPFDETIHFVDADFLKMFDFPLLAGNPATALDDPNDILLSTEMAEKYFGKGAAIGRELELIVNDTTVTVTVSGVIDARRDYSSLPFDFLMPIEQYQLVVPLSAFTSYNYGLVENYIQLDDQSLRENVEPQLTPVIEKLIPADRNRVLYGLQPLAGIHLEDEIVGNALYTSPRKLYFMVAMALLVVLIACINFITLSTGHALGRLKEIGVRRTLGALRTQLRGQLIAESFFTCLLAGGAGLAVAWTLSPVFGQLVDSPFQFSLGVPELFFLLAIMLVMALITGGLQSTVIVRKQTGEALAKKGGGTAGRNWFSEGLVVMQFALSIVLIIGAVTIRNQMQYIQQKDLGFEQERLLEIGLPSITDAAASRQLIDRFRYLARQDQRVLEVGASMNNAREPWTELVFEQTDGEQEALFFNQVDESYLQTMGIELAAGKWFDPEKQNATRSILVNERLVRHFGWDDPFSQQIPGKEFTGSHQIIGVVRDFHFSSLHQQIKPLILALDDEAIASGVTGLSTYVWPPNLYQLVVRIAPGPVEPVLEHLENSWKQIAPDKAFSYHFTDEVLAAKYAEEKRWGRVLNWASLFGIGIAWLGLLSLMRLSVQRRTKEIGIRKVLGSSTGNVILLLTRRFSLLVLTGSLLAWPVAWILLHRWLESFSYRIALNPILFLLVGLTVLLLTLGSIGLQSMRAARTNPVEALREGI
ncbi:ABC transporter permease [Flavilitoribacter nigricans]|uniref:FtsX-like permease family protein n=1 Tax=Flavilitoribacter nigricans (strain ATCC 23147 / DSM 23189 / NBRC 102662 / NCIMB 1420 / SS-2) TaxID=1122177 RepID=A0A2D0NII8_FLAN2|nr:ABC transporter permease [Flavilitoribacter nigricans]PHN08009.1 hypothetical protein CRP01_04435 [Flavilitoribacter nigricans DSM 23189 = NBRC 102662]